jgi:hypothetical protein
VLFFNFTFLCIFLVRGNLVSKHEQLLILMGIEASTLLHRIPYAHRKHVRLRVGYAELFKHYKIVSSLETEQNLSISNPCLAYKDIWTV